MTVTLSRSGFVAQICFAAPPHNFASADLLSQIADAADAIDADPELRCSVLCSDGKSFCAGADLAGDDAVGGDGGMQGIGQFYVHAERLFRRKKPMIAAVQGAAIGAGLGLALAADFRVGGPGARFSANFVKLGFHHGFAITHTLPRLIGAQNATWMMLSAQRMKPEESLAWGLVDRLCAAGEERQAAHVMAAELAANAPLAVMAVRATLQGTLADDAARTMRHELAEQSKLRETADYAEGVAAVFERREANFTGR